VRGWLRASLRIENEDDVIQEAYAKMFAHGGFEHIASPRAWFARVQRLIEALPERCRLIFLMRKVDGLPQRAIAERLRVSENIVEKEAAKGLRLVLQGLSVEAGGARRTLRLFGRRGRDAKADRR
jgi:RNA polymerase sigma-70 factor (ECF subfamily)